MRFSQKELIDNHARLMERNGFYREYGYNVEKNTAFVLSKALPLTGRILEIGTGKGRFLTALLGQASRVTTIDIDPQEQRFAAQGWRAVLRSRDCEEVLIATRKSVKTQ